MLEQVRRVVTLIDRRGASHCTADGEPPVRLAVPGMPAEIVELWATEGAISLPAEGDATVSALPLLPGVGGTRFRLLRIDPTPGADPRRGMHRSDSAEYLVVLSGQTRLVLPNGTDLLLNPGDVVVQNGTEHAWHNEGPEPCWIAVVLIGAEAFEPAAGQEIEG